MRRDRGYSHGRTWMALRTDREVELFATRHFEELRNRGGIEVQIVVDERDPVAVGGQSTGLDRVALAEVAVVVDDPYVPVASTLQQTLGGAVDRAVRARRSAPPLRRGALRQQRAGSRRRSRRCRRRRCRRARRPSARAEKEILAERERRPWYPATRWELSPRRL